MSAEKNTMTAELREAFKDWVDFDIAQHAIGVVLGFWRREDFGSVKGVFWGNNRVGDLLTGVLEAMAGVGVLLRDDDSRFRLNPDHDAARFRELYNSWLSADASGDRPGK